MFVYTTDCKGAVATLTQHKGRWCRTYTIAGVLQPFQDCSPDLVTNHLELDWCVPKSGLQYQRG